MSDEPSEPDIVPTCSNYDPLKVLYSKDVKIPVENAPVYENVQQFEAALKNPEIIPLGHDKLVKQREEEKRRKKEEEERLLQEKNKKRFAKYEVVLRPEKRFVNVLTRIGTMTGPLRALQDCVDQRLRVKVVTRNGTSIRGALYANLVAFDKQWNLALSDVLEVWKRKGIRKRKVPPALGTPVATGSALGISPVPAVTETALGGGVWECARHIAQLMVRGEHVVLINIVER